jgi:DNA-binding NarL/FixJ family response regulator
VVRPPKEPAEKKRPSTKLTSRQVEILDRVSTGQTGKEIAGALDLSEAAVKWHLAGARHRLNASSRSEAVAIAIRKGLL